MVALHNLRAQIEGLSGNAERGGASVADQAHLVELLLLRGHLLGRVADGELAARWALRLVHDHPRKGQALFARARTHSTFHRFSAALLDLDAAQLCGLDPAVVDDERAAIHQAVGRTDEALAIRSDAARRRATFESLGALAAVHAERREIAEARRMYRLSRLRYRGVSPFPLAVLDFQEGHMWLVAGDRARARRRFLSAVRRLPGYVPAVGHLAETDAGDGDLTAALARLRTLVAASDDPEYTAGLARLLEVIGRRTESDGWRRRASARYDELVGRHPAAFADHAAAFWLTTGGDPDRAAQLARINAEVRPTRSALELLARAERATSSEPGHRA